jgi:hypothetical protein
MTADGVYKLLQVYAEKIGVLSVDMMRGYTKIGLTGIERLGVPP